MASLDLSLSEAKKTKRKIHPSLRIDMTPMVDLGFLLISFFIFTTTMFEKKAMKLIMPADKGDSMAIPETRVLTLLLGSKNNVFAYEGKFEDAIRKNTIGPSVYDEADGIGKLIRQKQKRLELSRQRKGEDGLILLIKPGPGCTYKNIIDALDETTINAVKQYMLVDPSGEEEAFIQNASNRFH